MRTRNIPLALLAATVFLAPAARAVTALDLIRLQQEGVPLRLIDVRSSTRFTMGSIPGAMNVPSKVLLEKQFPPLGRVVLFSDGLGDVDMEGYAQALNQRPGVQAEILEGGYAAWLDERGPTTAPAGLQEEREVGITYDKLEALRQPVIFVDLRDKTKASKDGNAESKEDSLEKFCQVPGREYCRDAGELRKRFARPPQRPAPGRAKSRASHEPTPLIVLVDNDHVTAREERRRLKASGYNRVVVLVGGELAIETKGTRGMARVGGKVFSGRFGPGPRPGAPQPDTQNNQGDDNESK